MVQGDEPMVTESMINSSIKSMLNDVIACSLGNYILLYIKSRAAVETDRAVGTSSLTDGSANIKLYSP